MTDSDYRQMSIYMEPDIIAKLRSHVLETTGSLRGLSPYCREAIIARMKAEGVEIEE